MTNSPVSLDQAIRAKLELVPDTDSMGQDVRFAFDVEMVQAALFAVLDLHRQSETHVWDVPRAPSGEPRIELNPWCQCQERDGMAKDDGEYPCPTVRAIAEKLGVEVHGD